MMGEREVAIKVKTLNHFDSGFSLPFYATEGASGADIQASLPDPQSPLVLRPGEKVLIPTGLSFEIPQGYEIQVRPRSGLSWKTGLMIVNSPGTIDADYRGELKILMGNLGRNDERIVHGDRVAQLVVVPVFQGIFIPVEQLGDTSRGDQGFGSTGLSTKKEKEKESVPLY